MSLKSIENIAEKIQDLALVALLVFSPLARGATPKWAFAISAMLVILAFSAMFLRRLWTDRRPLPSSPLDAPVLVLLIVLAATIFVSIYRQATYLAVARFLVYAGSFYLVFEASRYRSRARLIVWTIVGMGALVSLIGLAKYLGAPIPAFWHYFPGKETLVTGPYMNHNHLAGYLEMSFSLSLGLLLFRSVKNRWVLSWLVVLMFFTLIWTMSRGGWIATLVGLIVLTLLLCRKYKVRPLYIRLGLAGLALVVTMTILGSGPLFQRALSMDDPREPSFSARREVWSSSIALVKARPILGSGLGTFPWSFTEVRPEGLTLRYREAHGDYVQIVTEAGLIVLVPLAWLGFALYRNGIRRLDKTDSRLMAGITAGALAGVTCILVHSLSDFNIQLTANGVLFAALIGLAVGPPKWKRSHQPSAAPAAEDYMGFGLQMPSGSNGNGLT